RNVRRRCRQRRKNAAGVKPARAALAEEAIPIDVAAFHLRCGSVSAIRAAQRGAHAESALREIQSVARFSSDTVVIDPAQPREIATALQHQIFDQTSDGIIDERSDDRSVQSEAATQSARDVVFAAAFPRLKCTRRGDASVARIESQHHFAEGDEIVLPVRSDLHLRDASSPDPPCAYSGCTLTTPNWRSSPSRIAAIIQRKLIVPPGADTFG